MPYTAPTPSTVAPGDTFPSTAYNIIAGDIADHETRIKTGVESYTTAQKTVLTGVTTGTVVYDSTLGVLQVWNGTTWVTLYSTAYASPYTASQFVGIRQRTTSYSTNYTTLASAPNVFTSSIPVVGDGVSYFRLQFGCAYVQPLAPALSGAIVSFWNATTSTGLSRFSSQNQGTNSGGMPFYLEAYYQAPVGTTDLNVRAFGGTTTAGQQLFAGTGVADVAPITFSVTGPINYLSIGS